MTGHKMLRSLGVGLAVAAMVTASATGALAKGPGGSNGGGGGKPSEGEDVGNNLSYPLLIAGETGYSGPLLRGTEYAPVLGTLPSDYLVLPDGTRSYYQQNANNTWQASNASAECAGIDVDLINWGDNLESKDWAYRQMIRVETQLYDEVGATMPDGGDTLAYEMAKTNDQTGKNEMWGLHTDSTGGTAFTYVPETAFVYTGASRLSIQQIDPATASGLAWDGGKWTGTGAGEVVVDVDTATSGDGITGYKGEISVSGNFVYGYVWNSRTDSVGPGEYRLTFSLDGLTQQCVSLAGAEIMVPVEEEGDISIAAEPLGNVPVVDDANNLTYIDVGLTSQKGGGRNK